MLACPLLVAALLASDPAPQPGLYQWVDGVDPFPSAPQGEGWGLYSGRTPTLVHLLLLELAPEETVEQALERRKAPAPRLVTTDQLVFEVAVGDGEVRKLTSVVVRRTPLLGVADLAECEVRGTPEVTISARTGEVRAEDRPALKLRWTRHGAQVLAAAAKTASPGARIYLVSGAEALGFFYLATTLPSPADLPIAEAELELARRLCAQVRAPAKGK
jgi:hypothetical protein